MAWLIKHHFTAALCVIKGDPNVGPNGLVDLYLNIISQLTCVIKRDPSVGPNGFVDLYPNIISQLACVLLKGTPMLGLMA